MVPIDQESLRTEIQHYLSELSKQNARVVNNKHIDKNWTNLKVNFQLTFINYIFTQYSKTNEKKMYFNFSQT